MNEARKQILERIAATVADTFTEPPAAPPYRRTGALDTEERVELFCRRVSEYRAEVQRITEEELATAITSVCATHDAARLVVASGIPSFWRSANVELVEDQGQSPTELDRLGGALTGCTAAIAETGTIILATGSAESRRALTLVPEALAGLAADGLDRRPLTFISGPSATSDIELSRVEGVHGPRDLVVLVVKESP